LSTYFKHYHVICIKVRFTIFSFNVDANLSIIIPLKVGHIFVHSPEVRSSKYAQLLSQFCHTTPPPPTADDSSVPDATQQ